MYLNLLTTSIFLGSERGIIEHPRQNWLRESAKSLGYPYIAISVCLGNNLFLKATDISVLRHLHDILTAKNLRECRGTHTVNSLPILF
jgi:hypothetical protein